jgi:hypothetical protein
MNPFNPSTCDCDCASRAHEAAKRSDFNRMLTYGSLRKSNTPAECVDFFITTTCLAIADATDETEYRSRLYVDHLRHSLAAGEDKAASFQTFHWKMLELGSAELAFRFQRVWQQTLPHLQLPSSGLQLGRIVINLRALENASFRGDDRWARAIMTRHFRWIMPLKLPQPPSVSA